MTHSLHHICAHCHVHSRPWRTGACPSWKTAERMPYLPKAQVPRYFSFGTLTLGKPKTAKATQRTWGPRHSTPRERDFPALISNSIWIFSPGSSHWINLIFPKTFWRLVPGLSPHLPLEEEPLAGGSRLCGRRDRLCRSWMRHRFMQSLYLIKKLLGKRASSFPRGRSSSIPEGRASPREEQAPVVSDLACSHCF